VVQSGGIDIAKISTRLSHHPSRSLLQTYSTDGEKTMPNDSGTEINSYTMNKDYDLVSVLYHALQAADTCAQYEQDAESEGSPEVAEFMRDVQEQNTRIAQQAKELLLKQQQI
jgi:hypothetical protein